MQFIFEKTREDQALVYYVECIRQNMQKDEAEVLNFVSKNFTRMVAAENFSQLTEDQLIKLLNSDSISERPQSERICAALK